MLWGMSFDGMTDGAVAFWSGAILLVFFVCVAFAGGIQCGRNDGCSDHCAAFEHDGGVYRDGQCICSDEVP